MHCDRCYVCDNLWHHHLGGLETVTGERGFVMTAHTIAHTVTAPPDYTSTNVLIGHSEHKPSFRMKHFLGKVFTMPTFRTEGSKKVLSVDAAFVAYPSPSTPGCSLTWTSDSEAFCFDPDQDEYIERVVPLSVRGENNRTHTVVGSREPTDGLAVRIFGAVSGVPLKGTVTGGRLLIENPDAGLYVYVYQSVGDLSVVGNSGSPVYTVPDTTGTVHIVGVLSGSVFGGGRKVGIVFNSWNDVTQGLGLKPIEALAELTSARSVEPSSKATSGWVVFAVAD